jgi:hypothetical protein
MGRNHRFSNLEVERFVGDIGLASRRLVSREYQQSSFQPRNTLRIPDRTEELFQDLAFYWSVGQVWRGLFEALSLSPTARVAEIGCGYVPKVAVGLHYFGARGVVDLIDSDPAALARAGRFLELMGSRFALGLVRGTLRKGVAGTYDAVFANHLVDDLILSHWCERRGIDIGTLYAREDRYVAVWGEIVATPRVLTEVIPSLAEALALAVRPKGLIVLLDYPSFSHRALGLNGVIDLVREGARLLRESLRANGAVMIPGIPSAPITIDRITVTQDAIVACRTGGSHGEL